MSKHKKYAPPARPPAFLRHLRRYIGTIVAVFAEGCAEGVTGMLMECTEGYIRLLVQAGPPPAPPMQRCAACPLRPFCPARPMHLPAPAPCSIVVDISPRRVTHFAHRV